MVKDKLYRTGAAGEQAMGRALGEAVLQYLMLNVEDYM